MIYLHVKLHVNILRAGDIYPTQRGLTDEYYDISLRVGGDNIILYLLPVQLSSYICTTHFPVTTINGPDVKIIYAQLIENLKHVETCGIATAY